jgi:hypothetical protein
MAQATVNLGQWKDFERDLTRFMREDQQRIIRESAEQVGVTFDDFVKEKLPPEPRPLKVAQYWTTKQRGWWWATMHAKANGQSTALPGWKAVYRRVEGRKVLVISGHYKRTGTLVRTLDFDVRQTANITTVHYGTNRPYAKWVIDLDGPQSKYHKGNWPTLQALLSQALPLLRKTFAEEVNRRTQKILGG